VALEPGDAVFEDTCEQVGNFPHGILTNPDSLELDPGVLGSSMCLSSRKQEYIDAFSDRDLTVCDEGDFAEINTPYIVKLRKKDQDPGPDPGISRYWLAVLWVTNADYTVHSKGPIVWPGPPENRSYSAIRPTSGGSAHGLAIATRQGSGSVSGDMWNGPGIWSHYENRVVGWGHFYTNNTHSATIDASFVWTGINETDFDEMTLDLTVRITFADDAGSITQTFTKGMSNSGQGRVALIGKEVFQTDGWVGDNGSLGSITKTGGFEASVELQWSPI